MVAAQESWYLTALKQRLENEAELLAGYREKFEEMAKIREGMLTLIRHLETENGDLKVELAGSTREELIDLVKTLEEDKEILKAEVTRLYVAQEGAA